MERLLTSREVAERLGLSVETIRRWSREGKIPALRHSENGPWRYRQSDMPTIWIPFDSSTDLDGPPPTYSGTDYVRPPDWVKEGQKRKQRKRS